ncbi:MAG: cadherin domain-containing protein [Pseudomonadota bacterium]
MLDASQAPTIDSNQDVQTDAQQSTGESQAGPGDSAGAPDADGQSDAFSSGLSDVVVATTPHQVVETSNTGEQSAVDSKPANDVAPSVSNAPDQNILDRTIKTVLISSALPEIETVSAAFGAEAHIIIYDSNSDNLSSINAMLKELVSSTGKEIGQLAIISHGEPGTLALSDAQSWTASSITADADQWVALGALLAPDARIDLYGCEVGLGSEGWLLVQTIASVTGASVWASNDDTGNVAGADWDLEVRSSESSLAYLIEPEALADVSISLSQSFKNVGFEAGTTTGWGLSGSTGSLQVVEEGSSGNPDAPYAGSHYITHVWGQGDAGVQTLASQAFIVNSLEVVKLAAYVDAGLVKWGIYVMGEGRLVPGTTNYTIDATGGAWEIHTVDLSWFFTTEGQGKQAQIHIDVQGYGGQNSATWIDLYETENPRYENVIPQQNGTEDNNIVVDADPATPYFTDDDDTHNLTFSVVDYDDNALQSAVLSGDTLTLTPKANWFGSTEVTIQATDSAGLSETGTFTAYFAPVNDAPTDLSLSNSSVDENKTPGSTVGTFSSVDPDTGDSHTYTFVTGTGSTDNGKFSIDGTTLKTSAVFDHETKNSYSIRVRTTDGGGEYVEETFTISVNDANDAPTDIALSKSNVDENGSSGTTVGNLTAQDPDSGSTFTYALIDNANYADNSSFQIVDNHLQTAMALDFESKSSYSIKVQVTDNGGATYWETFTISVNNTNDAPVIVGGISLSLGSIDEDDTSNAGMLIRDLIAAGGGGDPVTDQDAGASEGIAVTGADTSHGSWEYTIDGTTWRALGTPADTAARLLAADADTRVRFIPAADYNGSITDALTFRAWDRTTGANGGTANVTVNGGAAAFSSAYDTAGLTVDAVNDGPTDISLSNDTIGENAGLNAVVGNFSVTDPDAGDSWTYSLVSGAGGDGNGFFNISGNSLRADDDFDYEGGPTSYSIRVEVTDGGGLSHEEQFTIHVADVNETPTDITLSNDNVAENAGANAVVGTLGASDPDAGDTRTYSLVSGVGDDGNGFFNILGDTLRANADFDYEGVSASFSIRVAVTDGGGLSREEQFTIHVTDVNESPTDIALSNDDVPENAGANAGVGTFGASDPDAGDTKTYSLVSGVGDDGNGFFNIFGDTLRANDDFDYETGPTSYSIRVAVTDGGGLTHEEQFTINVTDVNDPPVLSDLGGTLGYTENDGAGVIDAAISLTDADDSNLESATVRISAGYLSGEDRLDIDPVHLRGGVTASWDAATGTLSLTGSASKADYEFMLEHVTYVDSSEDPNSGDRTVTWTVNDGDADSGSAMSTISVTPVNDAPVLAGFGGILTYTEGDGPIVIDGDVSLTDVDAETVTSAVVRITGNYQAGEDELGIAAAHLLGGVTASWDAATAALTLTGPASKADYAFMLEHVTYTDHSDDPNTGDRTVTWRVNDGIADSPPVTSTIAIAAVNDVPVLSDLDGTVTYTEGDAPVVIDGEIALTDVDGTEVTSAIIRINVNYRPVEDMLVIDATDLTPGVTAAWDGETGTLTLSGAASKADYEFMLEHVKYNNTGNDPNTFDRTVTWTVRDDAGDHSGTRTSTIVVVGVNNDLVYSPPPPVSTQPPQGDSSDTDTGFIEITLGIGPVVQNLISLMSTAGLLPSYLTPLVSTSESSIFSSMLSQALFSETAESGKQAWAALTSFVDGLSPLDGTSEQLTALEDFLGRLQAWQSETGADDRSVLFNSDAVHLAEWFRSIMTSADTYAEMQGQQGNSGGSQPGALIFNLDEIRVVDIFNAGLQGFPAAGIYASDSPAAIPMARVYDLRETSFIELVAA